MVSGHALLQAGLCRHQTAAAHICVLALPLLQGHQTAWDPEDARVGPGGRGRSVWLRLCPVLLLLLVPRAILQGNFQHFLPGLYTTAGAVDK